jgi:hypothetical protein
MGQSELFDRGSSVEGGPIALRDVHDVVGVDQVLFPVNVLEGCELVPAEARLELLERAADQHLLAVREAQFDVGTLVVSHAEAE